MQRAISLPGLEHLVSVCRQNALPLELITASAAPTPGEPLLESPLDPMLAAFYEQWEEAVFTDLILFQYEPLLRDTNEQLRRQDEQPFRSVLVFAQESSLAYYYATLPALADATGCQPVLYIDAHMERIVLPVASNVDRFFDVYARYLETLARDELYREEKVASVGFPWGVPELIAHDAPLVEALAAGRFEPWMMHDEGGESRQWLRQLLTACRV